MGEALVRRRLTLFESIIQEYGLHITIDLVVSASHRARISKQRTHKIGDKTYAVARDERIAVNVASHANHHFVLTEVYL